MFFSRLNKENTKAFIDQYIKEQLKIQKSIQSTNPLYRSGYIQALNDIRRFIKRI